jgi:2-keto-4-pentenoate hydratase/2-oxohepta-3-ene-1,7-dioic acid hydratase in catechol pathway
MSTDTPATFGLGTFSDDGTPPFPGLVVGGNVIDLRTAFGPGITTLQLLDDWEASLSRLSEIAAVGVGAGVPLATLRPRVPVVARQVLCAGANYRRHVREMAYAFMRRDGDSRPEEDLRRDAEQRTLQLADEDPFIFAGLPSALAGANDDIVLWGPGQQHDWELELAVVIGHGGRDIPVDQAMDHIAGYTISNDISTRDLLARPGFPMSDLIMCKSRPTFFPTGPYMVPRSAVGDLDALRLTLRVNGEVMQDETLADLIHPIDRLVAYASTAVELYPGDLLLTGSPAGNAGHHGNRWLRPGDLVEGEITGLGRLRNLCIAPTAN